MTEDEKPDERIHTEHWAQPYDSAAKSPGSVKSTFHVFAVFRIGRAEWTTDDGAEACRWMVRMQNRGASSTGYTVEASA